VIVPNPARLKEPTGSQRWIRVLVEKRPELLLDSLRSPLGLGERDTITWTSPKASDGYREYRDQEALRRAGIYQLPHRPLADFWPPRGPVWDAIGETSQGEAVFVEAKAHIAEAASPGSVAGASSLEKIRRSLAEVRGFYAPGATAEWSGRFYQYANRLAHHYLLREVNRLKAHLVFVYFVDAPDVRVPASTAEWRGAIELLHAALGLPHALDREGIHEIFVETRLLT
jgi:hypothetical protein